MALAWPAYGKKPIEVTDAQWVLNSVERLPPDAFLVAYATPLVWVGARRPAVLPSLVAEADSEYLGLFDDQGKKPLFLLKDHLWYGYAETSASAEKVLRQRYSFKPLNTVMVDSKEFGFFALVPLAKR